MIVYVNSLLAAWGRWAVRGRDGGVGWPSVSAMFKDAPAGSSYGSKPPVGVGCGYDDCEVTDKAVRRLDEVDQLFVREVYVVGGKTVEIAARLGCHRQRVPEKLERVHQKLLGHLNDLAAEG